MAKMITIDEKHPHIALVAVAVKEPRLVNGAWVEVDNTVEIPVRKARWDSLTTAAKKDVYAKECVEYHSPQGPGWEAKKTARRALWDADDKAAQDAKFVMRHVATTEEGIRVSVTWLGFTAEHVIANDPATARANAQVLHQAEKAKRDAEDAMVSAFNVG